MNRAVFVVPGNLDTPTGGYAYDKRIIHELRTIGWQIDVIDLGDTFPFPDDNARMRAAAVLAGIERNSVVVIDGLAYGVLQKEAAHLSQSCRIVALVHHPLALEAGLHLPQVQSLRASEMLALTHASAVVVTSELTKAILVQQYNVVGGRISVVLPGVDRLVQAAARDKTPRDHVHLLSVGSLVERKGYDVLIEALASLKDLPWRLVIAGDAARDPRVTQKLTTDISRIGCEDRIELTGAVSARCLQALYDDADVFVLASRFEGYGMVFGEAIAAGLPVVTTDVGAASHVIGGAGLIVPPDDVESFREALRTMIASRGMRKTMMEAAKSQAHHLPEWRDSGEQFAHILERLV